MPSLLQFWIIIRWFHCCIALAILLTEFLFVPFSHDNIYTYILRRERENQMNWFKGYLKVSFRLSCTNKRNECGLHTQRHFISSLSFCFYNFFVTIRCTFSITFSIVFNIRSYHPCMRTAYAHVCLFNRCLISLLFSFWPWLVLSRCHRCRI